MNDWLSVVPPLAAIALAIATRRVVLSLFLGVAAAALILARGHAGHALLTTGDGTLLGLLWDSFVDRDHRLVYGFTLAMGGLVGVMSRAGGMHGLVELIAPLARTRRRGQATGWLLGLVVFFDDYANTLLLGATLRPLYDRLRISREKLAYVVDSTAAPVAGLAVVSTFIAGELGAIGAGLEALDLPRGEWDPFGLFLASIPYRFYVLWALFLVGLVAISGRDFGPMLAAERRARAGSREGSARIDRADEQILAPAADTPRRWWNAALPVAVVLAAVMTLLVVSGSRALADEPGVRPTLVELVGRADSYWALWWASLAGLVTAVLMIGIQRLISVVDAARAVLVGAHMMTPALVILWLAWALSAASEQLGTAAFLGSLLSEAIEPAWLPTLVFVLAGAVAFSTGTSWGTMSILMPLVIPLAYHMLSARGATVTAGDPLMLGAVSGVLAGAIFGDHCSPISDTTVLSSRASGCDHIAHVRTQMPYALLVAGITIVCGTLPLGYGWPLWSLWVVGSLSLVACLLVLGRVPEIVDGGNGNGSESGNETGS